MGIEYVEYRIKIKNKHTKKETLVHTQLSHKEGMPLYKKDDFEIIDFEVVYG